MQRTACLVYFTKYSTKIYSTETIKVRVHCPAGENSWQGASRSEGGFKANQVSYYVAMLQLSFQ
jgi:hypothetical protein